ncbi:MAG: glycine cleavage system aminomethyltransferase GcvT [Candidatus Latescibacteria bacterium]|nr:glycine cleavage system aminomethyltransferase GcvT [Candidatus Latescibacterota bacterium]NIO27315.1 glycine cleavage system aminomethyltransferase GcvT [Candidatus Latescibacterota bacterium]NIO54839.1 glycine cleavage system aminomethyltransferase GcvT [Candidatus Latescibacterota bacterium]NIT00922.1 glycine cleavage system aminomethyltransferase GcvT [Candidatus Latescibacterota bacterium]NIT37845.1 glycine cleavage system aminomethyltransferase GcvT [Candidatus Latescibacterota bacteri
MAEYTGELKKTPLAAVHESLGAKMVPFAGFLMPVRYSSILDEHRVVREKVGIFDVSHMGEILISGRPAREFVNTVITNDCSKLDPGGVQYTVMCRPNGTIVDDLLVSVIEEDKFLLVVNAANREKDFEHIQSHRISKAQVEDISDAYALLAVQGPFAREVLEACPIFVPVRQKLNSIPYYRHFCFSYNGANIIVSRTGYTGELGFEVFVPPEMAPAFWDAITSAGKPFGIAPAGLAARDTLRFEASFCLYGRELDDKTTPYQAGLGWTVKIRKPYFVGKEALKEEKKLGPTKTLIGLELAGRSIGRQGYAVSAGNKVVGNVTSGSFSPTLKKSLCMAFVETKEAKKGDRFEVEIRGKRVEARRTPLPFYKSRAK